MDIEPVLVDLTEEDKEALEYEDKFERGELELKDYYVSHYFKNHNRGLINDEILHFIEDTLGIKTIGELVNRFDNDIKPRLLETFPYINNPEAIELLDNLIIDIAVDIFEPQTIWLGGGHQEP